MLQVDLCKPADFLVVLGDRYELLEYVALTVKTNIALAHIHGGEETEGSFDNRVRHALSKLAHLHFVAHEDYAARLRQMGEESWRIYITGSPALDLVKPRPCAGKHIMVAWQPVTLEQDKQVYYLEELQAALDGLLLPIIAVGPNSDPGSVVIDASWREWASSRPNVVYIPVMSPYQFWDLMANAAVLVGNSSAAFIEAASFELACVNIGTRQTGRFVPPNVINVGYDRYAIKAGIAIARSQRVREELRGMTNPLYKEGAAKQIVEVLKTTPLNDRLYRKQFVRVS